MLCAIMQPTYFPWLGYFDLIDQADKFVFLDNVKLEKSTWQVRNRIKTCTTPLYLTVNVSTPNGRMNTLINEAVVINDRWKEKHLKAIEHNYQKTDYYDEIYPFFKNLISLNYLSLSILNMTIIKAISNQLGIKTEFSTSSEMGELGGVKDQRLVSICQKLECEQYLSPVGSVGYLEKTKPGGLLVDNGIDLFYQHFKHPEYKQQHGEFISHLSIIDVLFNNGFHKTYDLILQGRRKKHDYISFGVIRTA